MLDFLQFVAVMTLVVFIASVVLVLIANVFLNREPQVLLFSTSITGTVVFILSCFVTGFCLRQIERRWYDPHTYMPMDFSVKAVLVLSAAAAGFCMVAWQIFVHRRRNRTQ